MLVIGLDEAGYGPNLGPLMVGGTCWEVPDWATLERLGEITCEHHSTTKRSPTTRALWGDSKQIYRGRQDFARLEQTVLASCAEVGIESSSWHRLLEETGADFVSQFALLPWYQDHDPVLPLSSSPEEIRHQACMIRSELDERGCCLHRIATACLFPPRWNELIAHHGKKSTVLTCTVLSLLVNVLKAEESSECLVIGDKHGARNAYAGMLASAVPESHIEIQHEGNAESRYRWTFGGRSIDIRFCVKGERWVPVALASMTAKYLREVAMRVFNAYWCRHIPGLHPTAGYPQDAKRFRREIDAKRSELGIEEHCLWRVK